MARAHAFPHAPKLRPVEIRTQAHNGEMYVLLTDPLALSEQSLLFPQALAPLLALIDGERSPQEIAAGLETEFGIRVDVALVHQVLKALDDCYLLENERSAPLVQAAHAANGAERPMLIAGHGYPESPQALASQFNAYGFCSPNGRHQTTECLGLLSPHIDYLRGGEVYAQVWQEAAQAAQAAEAVVIFATDHYGFDPFTLSQQVYCTPYGALPNDEPLCRALEAAVGRAALYAGAYRHRREHSVELVAVWLHHARQGQPCPIVPLLCGVPVDAMRQGRLPDAYDEVAAVLDTIQAQMRDRRVLIVASGDLSHVGPAFRTPPLNSTRRVDLHEADKALLGHMETGDADGFFRAVSAVQDRNNVCGLMPIFLTMKLLARANGRVAGRVTGYATCPADAHNTSVVTIAGVTFH